MTKLYKAYIKKEADGLKAALSSPTIIMHTEGPIHAARILGQCEGLEHGILVNLFDKLVVKEEEEELDE